MCIFINIYILYIYIYHAQYACINGINWWYLSSQPANQATPTWRLLPLLSSPLQNLLAYELHRGPMKGQWMAPAVMFERRSCDQNRPLGPWQFWVMSGHPFFSILDQYMQPVMFSLCLELKTSQRSAGTSFLSQCQYMGT